MTLLPAFGTISIGIGLVVGSAIDAVLLAIPTIRKTSARIVPNALPTTAIGLGAGALGLLVAALLGDTPLGGVLGALAAFGACGAAITLVRRDVAFHLAGLARRAISSSLAPGRA